MDLVSLQNLSKFWFIIVIFTKKLGVDYIKEYYPPEAFLPYESFQTIQENEKVWVNRKEDDEPVGYCSVWSAWFIDLRLSNPDVDKDELVKLAMNRLKKLKAETGLTFTSFIRNYSGLIVDISNEIQQIYREKLRWSIFYFYYNKKCIGFGFYFLSPVLLYHYLLCLLKHTKRRRIIGLFYVRLYYI